MRISYSSLETFQSCPLKYKFSEIDKLKEPKGKEAIFGSYLHKVLKWFYQNDPHFPTLDQLIDYYYKHWPKKSEGFQWTDEKEEADYFQEGLRMLRDYYTKNIPPSSVILDLESRFEAVIEEPDNNQKQHILTGIIDRIDKLPDGSVEIIDYKTGKRIPPQEQLNTNLQLSLYAIGLLDRWPKVELRQLRLSLYFLKFNEKLETRRETQDLETTKKKVVDVIHQIENSSFEPKPSNLCYYCGFRSICPVWRHFYEQKEGKQLNGLDIKEKVDEFFALQEQRREIEKRLKEIKNLIDVYASQKGLKRVFGKNGYLTKNTNNKISYDLQKVKKILEPLGKWEEVLKIDRKKLQKIMKEIPPSVRKELEKAKIIEKEYQYLEADQKSLEEIKARLNE